LDRNTGTVSTQFPFTDPVSEGIPITYLNPNYPGPAALQIIDLGSRVYEGTFLGAYAQDELGLGSRVRFVLGARYDNNRVHAVNDTGLVITAHNTKVSPKAAITLRVLDSDEQGSTQLSVYAQYSRAFKPPQAPAELAVALDPNNPLVSETITNYEAGLKGSTLNNHMAFEASVFNMLRDGVPVLQLIGTGLTFKESSAGKQRFKGIETGVTVEPVNELALHANYAFYDGKYEDFTIVDNNTTVNLSGRRVILSPRHMLDIGGVFDSGSGLGASLSGYYEGNKALDPKNTYFLGSFFIVNGRVSWRWQSYTAAVSATNILNKMYASDGEISSPLYVFPAPPRRIIGEFAIRF
jgi:outer membrane receptor protein involved in Fe transport